MNILKNLNAAMDYIESNLATDIDIQKAARIAGCSEYHFRRLFAFLAAMPLSEYVRRRRLTLAAQDLAVGARVVDVAVKYGYESPDAFSRAFFAQHGITPTQARAGRHTLQAFSRLSFQLTIKGGSTMDYRIVEKDAFRVVGISRSVTLVYEGVNPEIAAMWESLTPGDIVRLKELSNVEPYGLIQASLHFSAGRQEGGSLDHYIGVATDRPAPAGFAVLEVPAATWAVFASSGPFPQTLQNTWARIYAEWFPSSDFEPVEGPEILWVEGKDITAPDYRSEIWIPVRRTLKELTDADN